LIPPHSILKPKIQPLIPIPLSPCLLLLIYLHLLLTHRAPNALFLAVELAEIFALREEGEEGEGADGEEDFVARVVVGCVVGAVDFLRGRLEGWIGRGRGGKRTGSNHRANLHNDVVIRSRNGAFFDVEGVFGDPGRDNGVEVRIYRGRISAY